MEFIWSSFFIALLFLLIGVAIAAMCIFLLDIENGFLLVGILFAPSLIYLSFSGQLTEIGGGNIALKFQRTAAQRVILEDGLNNIEPLAKSVGKILDSRKARATFGQGTIVVLITTSRKDDTKILESVYATAQEIYPGLLQGNFELLVVLDKWNRPLGYFPKTFFLDLLTAELFYAVRGTSDVQSELRQWEARLSRQLEQTQLWDIVKYPEERARDWGFQKRVHLSNSNREALSAMAASELDAIVVVDDQGKYAGILRRRDIVSKLVVALTEDPKKKEEAK